MRAIDRNILRLPRARDLETLETLNQMPDAWAACAPLAAEYEIHVVSYMEEAASIEFGTNLVIGVHRTSDVEPIKFIMGWTTEDKGGRVTVTGMLGDDDVPRTVNSLIQGGRKQRREDLKSMTYCGWFMAFTVIGLVGVAPTIVSMQDVRPWHAAGVLTLYVLGIFVGLPYLISRFRIARLWPRDPIHSAIAALETVYKPAAAV